MSHGALPSTGSLLGWSAEPQGKGGDSRATAYGWQVVDHPRARPRGPVAAGIQPTLCSLSRVPGRGLCPWEKGQSSLTLKAAECASRECVVPSGAGAPGREDFLEGVTSDQPCSSHLLVPAVCERAESVAVCAAEGEHQQHRPAGLLPSWCLPRGQVELLPPEGQDRWE